MVNTYKICYLAQWPDGKLLDEKKPYAEAFVQASSKHEAAAKLINELKGLKVKIVEEPQVEDISYEP